MGCWESFDYTRMRFPMMTTIDRMPRAARIRNLLYWSKLKSKRNWNDTDPVLFCQNLFRAICLPIKKIWCILLKKKNSRWFPAKYSSKALVLNKNSIDSPYPTQVQCMLTSMCRPHVKCTRGSGTEVGDVRQLWHVPTIEPWDIRCYPAMPP